MKKRVFALFLCAMILFPSTVSADVLNYEATINTYKQDSKTPYIFLINDGAGKEVHAVAKADTLYVTAKDIMIRSNPGEKGRELRKVLLGTKLQRVAVCDNGWSKVTFQKKGENKIIGYVPDSVLSDTTQMKKFNDTVKVAKDSDILDFPGRKDGEVVGEVIQEDQVNRTGIVNEIWSRILYEDERGVSQVGYIPTNVLEGQENTKQVAKADTTVDTEEEAGVIHKSKGKGIFAEAVDGVTAVNGSSSVAGVQVGTPVSASSDAVLKPLGNFRITHYCQCSICCGSWANGITSTGVTATTNRTIAVDPTQIPYGSKVVINGQVYVAEDCGGAIKTNCIDIYVATHDEGESKGVYYTDVYLLQE
ncbi:MAG: 3D domain-containing protein [Eubacteriales bacterium]|nr:3D domain-containing protein [Eubacteriales bacterium]